MSKEPGRSVEVETLPGAFGDMRAASTTGTGTALSTTPAVIRLPAGTSFVSFQPRNYSTAVGVQISLCPYLSIFKTTDDGDTFTDYSENAQDGSTSTDLTLSSLDTLANGDWLYIGAHRPWRGLVADVDSANGTASVLTVEYWNGVEWADISATDGTASGGATFAVDGNITWTVPSGWKPSELRNRKLYWLRLQVSAALDSSTTLNSLMPLGTSTAYWDMPSGDKQQVKLHRGIYGFSGVEARTDAGTANLIVNVACGDTETFPA